MSDDYGNASDETRTPADATDVVFEPNEFPLPSDAQAVVEMLLNGDDACFVFEARDYSCVTFISLKSDGTWNVEQA